MQITGVEVSQAIQIFGSTHLVCTNAANQPVTCADNSIPLVAGKRIAFRVYVRNVTAGATLSGGVSVHGQIVGAAYDVTPSATPQRVNVGDSVNIVTSFPADPGTWQYNVFIWENLPGGGVGDLATISLQLEAHPRRTIPIRLVRINYRGRGMNIPAPTVQDFWLATDFAQRALPIPNPGFTLVADSVEVYDGDFTRIDPSAHDTTWPGYAGNRGTTGNLLNILDRLVASETFPTPTIWVAIYPDNVRQSAYGGWAVGRWIISDRSGETFAHEVLHHFGSPQHAPGCGAPNADPNYPAYSMLPPSSIGEVGFDLRLLRTYDPAAFFDLMSYCQPKWISPYTYQHAFNALAPPPPPPAEPPLHPWRNQYVRLSLQQLLDRYVKVELPHIPRPLDPPPQPRSGRYTVELLAPDGRTLTKVTADPVNVDWPEGYTPIPIADIEVPWHDEAAVVRVLDGREVILNEGIAGQPPGLEVEFPPAHALAEGTATLRLAVTGGDGHEIHVVVRATNDGGATWVAMPVSAEAHEVELDEHLLRPGPDSQLEIIAAAGYRATSIRSEPFAVRCRTSAPLILAPAEGTHVRRGEPVELAATSGLVGSRHDALMWSSDLEGPLGTGAQLSVTLRQSGRHLIEVASREPFGGASTASVLVE
ncbi:MAG TPA: hypothetical protein VGF54_19580 [Streptosporangiaceae bacterium]|jgi:hypothetical protein